MVDSRKNDHSCPVTIYVILTTDDLQTGVLFRHRKCLPVTSERNSKKNGAGRPKFVFKNKISSPVSKFYADPSRPFSPMGNLCWTSKWPNGLLIRASAGNSSKLYGTQRGLIFLSACPSYNFYLHCCHPPNSALSGTESDLYCRHAVAD